jgi:type II restriction/modification system DNA methylase subunit YeeA
MLNPESITILDPACGSGHILIEAYDLLKQICLEH